MSAHGDGHMLQSLQAFMNDIAAPPVPPKKKRSRDASLAAPHSDAKRVRGEKEAAMLSALEAAVAAERLVPESAAPAAPSGPVRLQAAPTNHRIDDMFQGRHQQVAAGYAAKRGEMTAAGVKRAAAAAAASSIAAKPKNAAQRAAQVQNVPRYIQDNQLGKEQLRGVRMIMDASGTRLSGRNCFVSGPGGAGKSFLITALIQRWKRHGIRFKITATTGVAASLIRGMTFHSLMKLGLMRHPISKLRVLASRNKELIAEWKDLQVLIIDEISMWSPRMIRILDEVARVLRPDKRHLPFGGVQMIFVGDFFQLSPVFTDADRVWTESVVKEYGQEEEGDDLVYDFAFEHPLWEKYIGTANVVLLRQNFRQGDAVFARILDGLRKGVVTDEAHKVLNERAFHTATFASTEEMRDPVSGLRPTEIYPTNEEADAVNQREFDKLCASDASKRIPVYTFRDIRIEETKEARPIFDAYIANMQKDSLAKGEINLCIGSQVMLLANLDTSEGLVNGARGRIIGLSPPIVSPYDPVPRAYPVVRFENGITHTIEPKAYECSYEGSKAQCFYVQLPLRLSDASSVHKSQGQTLDRVYGDVRKMFRHGQAYTFYSRVRSIAGLFHKNYSRKVIVANPKVRAYYERLEAALALEEEAEAAAAAPVAVAVPFVAQPAPAPAPAAPEMNEDDRLLVFLDR